VLHQDAEGGGNVSSRQKAVKAREWGIEVVGREWLVEVLRVRTVPLACQKAPPNVADEREEQVAPMDVSSEEPAASSTPPRQANTVPATQDEECSFDDAGRCSPALPDKRSEEQEQEQIDPPVSTTEIAVGVEKMCYESDDADDVMEGAHSDDDGIDGSLEDTVPRQVQHGEDNMVDLSREEEEVPEAAGIVSQTIAEEVADERDDGAFVFDACESDSPVLTRPRKVTTAGASDDSRRFHRVLKLSQL
jgi:hypothetical protein